MNIGDNFQHKYITNLTAEILDFTAKGYKVRQTQGKKSKTAFYDKVDFERSERGLFTTKK